MAGLANNLASTKNRKRYGDPAVPMANRGATPGGTLHDSMIGAVAGPTGYVLKNNFNALAPVVSGMAQRVGQQQAARAGASIGAGYLADAVSGAMPKQNAPNVAQARQAGASLPTPGPASSGIASVNNAMMLRDAVGGGSVSPEMLPGITGVQPLPQRGIVPFAPGMEANRPEPSRPLRDALVGAANVAAAQENRWADGAGNAAYAVAAGNQSGQFLPDPAIAAQNQRNRDNLSDDVQGGLRQLLELGDTPFSQEEIQRRVAGINPMPFGANRTQLASLPGDTAGTAPIPAPPRRSVDLGTVVGAGVDPSDPRIENNNVVGVRGRFAEGGDLDRNQRFQAYQDRLRERRDNANRIKTETAGMRSWGRTGGVSTTLPLGPMGRPVTLTQPTFGPGMSLAQAAGVNRQMSSDPEENARRRLLMFGDAETVGNYLQNQSNAQLAGEQLKLNRELGTGELGIRKGKTDADIAAQQAATKIAQTDSEQRGAMAKAQVAEMQRRFGLDEETARAEIENEQKQLEIRQKEAQADADYKKSMAGSEARRADAEAGLNISRAGAIDYSITPQGRQENLQQTIFGNMDPAMMPPAMQRQLQGALASSLGMGGSGVLEPGMGLNADYSSMTRADAAEAASQYDEQIQSLVGDNDLSDWTAGDFEDAITEQLSQGANIADADLIAMLNYARARSQADPNFGDTSGGLWSMIAPGAGQAGQSGSRATPELLRLNNLNQAFGLNATQQEYEDALQSMELPPGYSPDPQAEKHFQYFLPGAMLGVPGVTPAFRSPLLTGPTSSGTGLIVRPPDPRGPSVGGMLNIPPQWSEDLATARRIRDRRRNSGQ
jgi:hypothetical protein